MPLTLRLADLIPLCARCKTQWATRSRQFVILESSLQIDGSVFHHRDSVRDSLNLAESATGQNFRGYRSTDPKHRLPHALNDELSLDNRVVTVAVFLFLLDPRWDRHLHIDHVQLGEIT